LCHYRGASRIPIRTGGLILSAGLRTALVDPATRTEALKIRRGLLERVTVKAEGKGFTIELGGEIASMVAMEAQAKNTKAASKEVAVSNVFARSAKAVAGARNRLNLLLVTSGNPALAGGNPGQSLSSDLHNLSSGAPRTWLGAKPPFLTMCP
jgi:hypothetical protein